MIQKCTCVSLDRCKCPVLINCNCEKCGKIPQIEQNFIDDQRSSRIGKTANIDLKETAMIGERNERNEQKNKLVARQSSINSEANCSYVNVEVENTDAEITSPLSAEKFENLKSANYIGTFVIADNYFSSQMKLRLPATALASIDLVFLTEKLLLSYLAFFKTWERSMKHVRHLLSIKLK